MPARTVLALAAIILTIHGCGPERAKVDQTIRVDLVGTPDEIDRAIVAATHIGLVSVDSRGDVTPGLASSWRIGDDHRSVIFRLAERRWPSGKRVTGTDVVTSFRRLAAASSRSSKAMIAMLENGTAILRGGAPPTALGVDSPVDDVVEVKAAGYMPSLLALLAQPEFTLGAVDAHPPSFGPFQAADRAKHPVLLVPRPAGDTSRQRAVIALFPTQDSTGAIARFAHDHTDLVIGRGLSGFDDARLFTAANALRVEPTWGVYGYLVHPVGPLADPGVRRALAMAIDRDDLGSRLFGVALPPVLGIVPLLPSEPVPALPDWAAAPLPERLALARRLLDRAGFGDANPLHVAISLPEAREHANVAAEIASDWSKIGVVTTTVTRSLVAHTAAIRQGDYQLAMVERFSSIDNATYFLLPFDCLQNSYCNHDAEARLAEAQEATDPAAAVAATARAEAAIVADTPMIALFSPIRWALVAPRVTGWTTNAAGQHPLARLGFDRGR